MGFYSDVKPGEPFRPSASLSNDVRHLLNRMNGFGGGVNPAGNPGIVRIPVYNSTSAVLSEGKAVSIDISGVIAGECYPAIAFSDEMPCYGVLAKDLNPAEVGDCILSGLAVVQIATTPATGNYATPGTGGVFTRGDEGVPIVNISGTAAVVMLGAAKTSGGGTTEHASNISWGIVKTDASVENWTGTGNPPQDRVPMTQAVFDSVKEQYWKPNYGGGHQQTVNICYSNSYIRPASGYVFKPASDGNFFIEFCPLYGAPEHEVKLQVYVYSENPITNPLIGSTEDHWLYYSPYEHASSSFLWYPALKKHWYYFWAQVHDDDLNIIRGSVQFFETQK